MEVQVKKIRRKQNRDFFDREAGDWRYAEFPSSAKNVESGELRPRITSEGAILRTDSNGSIREILQNKATKMKLGTLRGATIFARLRPWQVVMSYTKTIVCLANSRKLAGRCVAGKEWDGSHLGAWCRPVSARDRGELTAERWYCKTWRDPQLLDLIEVGLLGPRPSTFQTENHLVDASVRWKYAGHVSARHLVSSLDKPTGPLWANGESTGSGLNDKVPAALAERQRNSLVLVQPELLTIRVGTEGADVGNPRRRVRGHFWLAGHDYVLAITDPIVEKQIMSSPDGSSSELQNPILCISLSEKYNAQNACYKLIAGVMRVCL